MRLVVTGGRDYADRDTLNRVLDDIHQRHQVTVLIEGEAPGADTLAREWAEARGVPVKPYPARWSEYGRRAGPLRNQQMIDEGMPDGAAVFYDRPRAASRGTADMHWRLERSGVPVLWVEGVPEPPVPDVCGKCGEPATYPWPATGGTIMASPCRHVLTYDEALLAFPERMEWAATVSEEWRAEQ